MIYYNLPNGKTVRFNDVFDLLNADDQKLMADNAGTEYNNPFFGSTLSGGIDEDDDIVTTIELPDIDSIEEVDIEEDFD
jgi:hypothetical protein